MKLKVASKNPQKIQALKDLLPEYPIFNAAEVEGIAVPSGVSDQPKTLEETIRGGMNRAKNAFIDCDLSFGIESGLMKVSESKSGVVDLCVCVIYDGEKFHLGFSSIFEVPPKIVEFMDKGMNMSDASLEARVTENKSLGSAEGLIGILTKGRVTRLAYTKQAIVSAMIHLENKELF